MFHSNQELSITGDIRDKKQLENFIKLFFEGYNFKPQAYKINEKGQFIFYFSNNISETIKIGKDDCNIKYLVQLVELYFSSSIYTKTIYSMSSDCIGLDGSLQPGWCASFNNNEFKERIIFTPFWCFYFK